MTKKLQRNLTLYPWYAALFHAYFWLPVYFLFFQSKFDLANVLLLESIYFASVVAMEVPSGWFSDMFGRKRTLVAASLFLCTSYVLFLGADSFNMFAIAQILLAAGIAFNSGTDTSFLLESTQALGVEDEYGQREAFATRANFLGTAVAGVFGGLAAMPDFRGAYVLSFIGAIGLLIITLRFTEPFPEIQNKNTSRVGLFKQVTSCIGLLRNIRLFWLSAFAVFMIVMNHIPYEFYQPYVEELASQYEIVKATPLLTSLHLTLTMLVAAWIASKSIQMRDQIGTVGTLISAAGLQLAMITVMHLFVNAPSAIATLLRSCPRALMTAPLNAAVAPNIPASKRATFLSLQSLFGRLGFASTLAIFAYVVGGDDWASITLMLQWGMWAGIVGLVVLVVTSPVVREK